MPSPSVNGHEWHDDRLVPADEELAQLLVEIAENRAAAIGAMDRHHRQPRNDREARTHQHEHGDEWVVPSRRSARRTIPAVFLGSGNVLVRARNMPPLVVMFIAASSASVERPRKLPWNRCATPSARITAMPTFATRMPDAAPKHLRRGAQRHLGARSEEIHGKDGGIAGVRERLRKTADLQRVRRESVTSIPTKSGTTIKPPGTRFIA